MFLHRLIPRLTGEGFNRVSRLSKVVVDEAKAQENGGVEGGRERVNEEGGWGSIDGRTISRAIFELPADTGLPSEYIDRTSIIILWNSLYSFSRPLP